MGSRDGKGQALPAITSMLEIKPGFSRAAAEVKHSGNQAELQPIKLTQVGLEGDLGRMPEQKTFLVWHAC